MAGRCLEGEVGGLKSPWGSRVGQDWATKHSTHTVTRPVILLGLSRRLHGKPDPPHSVPLTALVAVFPSLSWILGVRLESVLSIFTVPMSVNNSMSLIFEQIVYAFKSVKINTFIQHRVALKFWTCKSAYRVPTIAVKPRPKQHYFPAYSIRFTWEILGLARSRSPPQAYYAGWGPAVGVLALLWFKFTPDASSSWEPQTEKCKHSRYCCLPREHPLLL